MGFEISQTQLRAWGLTDSKEGIRGTSFRAEPCYSLTGGWDGGGMGTEEEEEREGGSVLRGRRKRVKQVSNLSG